MHNEIYATHVTKYDTPDTTPQNLVSATRGG